jgi:hypothetical protein
LSTLQIARWRGLSTFCGRVEVKARLSITGFRWRCSECTGRLVLSTQVHQDMVRGFCSSIVSLHNSSNMSATHLPRAMPLTHTLRAFNHPRIQQQLIRRAPRLIRNYASQPADTSNLRPLVLEKPDKFRPPSHPSRKPGPRRSFGPRLTNEEMEAQKTKEYPHMMPPEGSFKHKLLTSRGFHVWLSMVPTTCSYRI